MASLSSKKPGFLSSLSYQVRHLTTSKPFNGYNLPKMMMFYYFQAELIIIIIIIIIIVIINIMIWL